MWPIFPQLKHFLSSHLSDFLLLFHFFVLLNPLGPAPNMTSDSSLSLILPLRNLSIFRSSFFNSSGTKFFSMFPLEYTYCSNPGGRPAKIAAAWPLSPEGFPSAC